MGVAVGSGAAQVSYLDSHPAGARKGWEPQYKKQQLDIYFTNDTTTVLPQPLYATDESGTDWKQSYVYGANDERISMSYLPSADESTDWEPVAGASGAAPNTSPETLYYLEDSLDSVLALLNNDDEVALRYHYDAFGVATDAEKFDHNYPGPDNLFGYTGLGYDASSGLSYARARYFDSSIGRFISQDTYEGQLDNPLSLNLYTYVENNPLRYVDPTGKAKVKSGFYDSWGAKLDNITTDPDKAAENLTFASNNWWHAQSIIESINNGTYKGFYNKVEYWKAYQKSMSDYANAQRNWIGSSGKLNIQGKGFLKLEAGANFLVGVGAEISYDGEYLVIKVKSGANGQIGISGSLTLGAEMSNGGEISKGVAGGIGGGKLLYGEIEGKIDSTGQYWELAGGAGIGLGIEVKLVPIVSAKAEGNYTVYRLHLPLDLPEGGDYFYGAPTYEEWMSILGK